MAKWVRDEAGIFALKTAVVQDRIEYVADMRSLYEDKAPKGVTGDLAASAEQYDTFEESILSIMQSYAPYIEDGTEPGHRLPLIPLDLGPRIVKKIRKMSKGKFPAGARGGSVLVPIVWEWVRKVLAISDQVEAYLACWGIYKKIYREGIRAQKPLRRSVEEMKSKQHLYRLAESTGGEIRRS